MHCKKTIDARSYAHETLEQLRRDAVKRVESGESPEAVAAGLGINRRTIYRWLSAYHYGGEQALAARRIPGAPAKLDARQMAQLSRMIRDKSPLQFKFEYALWTLAIIRGSARHIGSRNFIRHVPDFDCVGTVGGGRVVNCRRCLRVNRLCGLREQSR